MLEFIGRGLEAAPGLSAFEDAGTPKASSASGGGGGGGGVGGGGGGGAAGAGGGLATPQQLLWALYLAEQLTLQQGGPALMVAMVGGGRGVLLCIWSWGSGLGAH